MLEGCEPQLRLALGEPGPQQPLFQLVEDVLRELELSLLRARLTQREAELWLTAFKHLGRAVAGGASPR